MKTMHLSHLALTTLCTLALCCISNTALAQQDAETPSEDARPFHFTLQLDPLTTALGFVHLQLEHAPTAHFSYYVGPHLRLFDSLLSQDREDYTGLGIEAGIRYFFKPHAPEGLWVGTRGVIARQTTPIQEAAEPAGYVSALGGYTWISDSGFVLSGGAGVQYIHYQIAGLGPKGVFPALHTAFGTAF